MSIERQSKLWSGPPIIPADPAMEREQLIAAGRPPKLSVYQGQEALQPLAAGETQTDYRAALRGGPCDDWAAAGTIEVYWPARCRNALIG
jgi:hypothetical protein